MKNLNVILLSVNSFKRKTAENIENISIDYYSLINLINQLEDNNILNHSNNSDDVFKILPMTDFMDECNNQSIILDEWWITYVKLK